MKTVEKAYTLLNGYALFSLSILIKTVQLCQVAEKHRYSGRFHSGLCHSKRFKDHLKKKSFFSPTFSVAACI
jgi:hypothetical protein